MIIYIYIYIYYDQTKITNKNNDNKNNNNNNNLQSTHTQSLPEGQSLLICITSCHLSCTFCGALDKFFVVDDALLIF